MLSLSGVCPKETVQRRARVVTLSTATPFFYYSNAITELFELKRFDFAESMGHDDRHRKSDALERVLARLN